jgi:hypothetical protein
MYCLDMPRQTFVVIEQSALKLFILQANGSNKWCFVSPTQARKQCFLVCPPLGNMAIGNNVSWFVHLWGHGYRKQCFLVCPPLGNMAKKQCSLVCPPLGNMARKQCFLACSPSGNMARKQCYLVYSLFPKKHSYKLLTIL